MLHEWQPQIFILKSSALLYLTRANEFRHVSLPLFSGGIK